MDAMPGLADAATATDRPVRRRHVFQVSGFDPQGPAHYYRMYAEESAKQAAVSGYSMEVGRRQRRGPHSSTWHVRQRGEAGADVSTTVEFLRWDDIVRSHWPRSRWAVMLSALATTARQIGNGVLWRILKTSWPAFVVLFLPPLLVVSLLAALVGIVAAVGALAFQGEWLVAAGCGVGAFWLLAKFASWAEAKTQMAWLMRSTRFILRQARGEASTLETRLDEFARRLDAVVESGEVDEVLVVGHSSGAMLAVSLLARSAFVRGSKVPAPTLSLLTLGECIPMLSYQPEAVAFRSELAVLARSARLEWLDFTAPPDGCCFALVDPTAVCLAGPDGGEWRPPKRLSPRFAQLFSPSEYALLREDKYRCHFQYLMSSERSGSYDFFAITAGELTLAARYAGSTAVENFRDFQMFGGPGA